MRILIFLYSISLASVSLAQVPQLTSGSGGVAVVKVDEEEITARNGDFREETELLLADIMLEIKGILGVEDNSVASFAIMGEDYPMDYNASDLGIDFHVSNEKIVFNPNENGFSAVNSHAPDKQRDAYILYDFTGRKVRVSQLRNNDCPERLSPGDFPLVGQKRIYISNGRR